MTTPNPAFTDTDADVRAELAALRADVSQLRNRSEQAENRYQRAARRARLQTSLAFAALTGAIFLSPGNRAAIAQGYGMTLQQLAARLTTAESNVSKLQNRATALETKTQFMTANTDGKWTTFSGCNVYIQNGLGATNGNPQSPFDPKTAVTNGLGNLIIGYNQSGNFRGDQRGGSHNLVLGDANNYTNYGGLVAGLTNMISGDYATITGGAQGLASGELSSISGGLSNVASGTQASISGGGQNTASGANSSVGGGVNNVVGGYVATVSGGVGITQNDTFGWAAGNLHSP